MAKKCCVNKLIYNSIVGVPPDIDPPISGPLFHVYELIIDTTGAGANPTVVRLRINGNTFNIIDQSIRPNGFVCDLNPAATTAGAVDGTTSGTISFQQSNVTNLNYFCIAGPNHLGTVELSYNDDNGNIVWVEMIRRDASGCVTTGTIIDSLNPILYAELTSPINTGGTGTIRTFLGGVGAGEPLNGNLAAGIVSGLTLFMQGFYDGFTSLTFGYTWTGAGTGVGEFENCVLPITLLDDDFGTTYSTSYC